MKLTCTLLMLAGLACTSQAATRMAGESVGEGDSTSITTIADIIRTQTKVFATNSMDMHWHNVWDRKAFFNISYGNSTLDVVEAPTQSTDNFSKQFTTDLSVGIEAGRRFALHKRPIANMALFSLNFTPFDVNYSHYTSSGDGTYDSSAKFKVKSSTYHDRAWNLAKHRINYNFLIGPQLTLHPFALLSNQGLHDLSFHIYYQIGYSVSLLLNQNDPSADIMRNPNNNAQTSEVKDFEDDFKGDLGHGLATKFGLSLSWKAIGVGFESTGNKYTVKSLRTSTYGPESFKMNNSGKYFFINFRF